MIPRSRSMSMRSRYCARIERSSTTPVSCSIRSAKVDLPWSMCAMMQKLRMIDGSVRPGGGATQDSQQHPHVLWRIWPADGAAGSVIGCACTAAPHHHITEEFQRPVVANIKSQLKRIKTNEKSRQRNKATKSALKTSIRRFREAAAAGDAEKATELRVLRLSCAGQGSVQGRHPQESGCEPQVRDRGQGGSSGALRQEEALPPGTRAPRRRRETLSTARSNAYAASSAAPLTSASATATTLSAVARPPLIPATRLGTHRLELPGRHPDLSSQVCFSLPAARRNQLAKTADAGRQALVISTGATPVASAQRSCSIATPVRPANAASATAKLVTSDRPPK